MPDGATSGRLVVTTIGGATQSTADFGVLTYTEILITPATASLEEAERLQLSAAGLLPDGSIEMLTGVTWSSADASIADVDETGLLRALKAGSTTVTATFDTLSASASITVTSGLPLPADPSTIAPALDQTAVVSLGEATEFLYTGPQAIQTGVAEGTIHKLRAAVIRGRVKTTDGYALRGVTVTILGRGEYGQTLSRADGLYDLVVNGGETVTLAYERSGYITAQRTITTEWLEYTVIDDVVLVPYDSRSTVVTFGANSMQVVEGSIAEDATGVRRAVLLVPAGTTAIIELPDGTTQAAATLTLRATELTVGTLGPSAMPAELPPGSGYTYCVELSADEAVAADARTIRFSRQLPLYVENFIGFPVGTDVPLGYYDRSTAAWVPADDGRVVKITSISAGLANIDITGDGAADSATALAALGIDTAERQQLATLYAAGQSLWRMAVTHFTPWDGNWPYGPPDGAEPPQIEDFLTNDSTDQPGNSNSPKSKPVTCPGSVIECENEALGEAAPITGTPFTLHYKSDRVPGRTSGNEFKFKLTKATIPPGLQRVDLQFTIAGQSTLKSYGPSPNLEEVITWDGRDAYGRVVQGGVTVTATLGYVYNVEYKKPAEFEQSFAKYSGVPITANFGRTQLTLSQTTRLRFAITGPWTNGVVGLGGWSVSEHHAYDPATRTVYFGTGARRTVADEMVLERVAGNGNSAFSGDGGPAAKASLRLPKSVVIAADGTTYISDSSARRIREVSEDGTIRTIAGTGGCCAITEGSPATTAQITPEQITFDQAGRLVFVNTVVTSFGNNSRIFRIETDGTIKKLAGVGTAGYSGDGGKAIDANINARDIAFAADGTMYIADFNGLRVVSRDGTIRTIGQSGFGAEFTTDRPASAAKLACKTVAVGPDGSIYMAWQRTIRRLGPDGVVRVIAGAQRESSPGTCPASDEGGTADCLKLDGVEDLAVAQDGTIYFSDVVRQLVRKISTGGIVSTIAGGGFSFAPTDGALTKSIDLSNSGIALGHDSSVYIATTFNPVIWKARPLTPWFETTDVVRIASEDGNEVYEFNAQGRHVQTRSALDGTALLTFAYDGRGQLASITDFDGRTTQIEREDGSPVAIVAPTGERTTLTLDTNGYLASIKNPADETRRYTYSDSGLLLTYTNPRGGIHEYGYDSAGRLRTDKDAANATTQINATRSGSSVTATVTSPMGRTRQMASNSSPDGSVLRTMTDPLGRQTITSASSDGTTTTTSFSGLQINSTAAPDLRFGMQAPVASRQVLSAGSKTITVEHERTLSLANSLDIFSLTSVSDAVTINGRTWLSSVDVAARKTVTRSPAGRLTSLTFDGAGRPQAVEVPGVAPVTFSRDGLGRVRAITHGSRQLTLDYDAQDRVKTITDSLGRSTLLTYDPAGRPLTQTLPGGRTVEFRYDPNGNMTSLTPSGRPRHEFTFDAADRMETYKAPTIGEESSTTRYRYDAEGSLVEITPPNGRPITFEYDAARQLKTMSGPDVALHYSLNAAGNLTQISGADATVSYAYDGAAVTSATLEGPVSGSVTWTYDDTLRVVAENGIAYSYDDDGVLQSAGALLLIRDAASAFILQSTLGNVTDAYEYNEFGEVIAYHAFFGTTPLLSLSYTRDGVGRVMTIGSQGYEYDPAGRLVRVTNGGAAAAEYTYDSNGNRTEHKWLGGSESGTYDDQDRLLEYDDTSYEYTATGDLMSMIVAGAKTSYDYDALGNLRQVELPGGTTIAYLMDGENRRVGKKVNDVLVRGWLYADQLRIVAEVDGTNTVVSRFVYATRSNVPDYMIRAGVTYRILSDHLGSPRIVIDVETGNIAQTLAYDEFGKVVADTNPGFQPFGFAGGLYDRDTGLVHFGARDYDPRTGRWTTKDPIGFDGGDTNLYAYTMNDPVNLIDPSGLLFGGTIDAGEAYGEAALGTYADILTDSNAAWYEKAGAAAGGFFSALWTPCTSDSTFTVLSTAAGAAGGLRAAGSKAAGKEFSHWIPDRYLKRTGSDFLRNSFGRSPLNGNYVSKVEHALSDPKAYRFMPRAWKEANPMPNRVIQQWNRIPKVYKGTAAGAVVGSAGQSTCGCS